MNQKIKEEILSALNQASAAINRNDVVKLRDLSNQTISSGSIFQDEDIVTVAILMYSLSKIFERTDYKETKSWNLFYKSIISNLGNAKNELIKNNFKGYNKSIASLFNTVDKLDSKLKTYVKDLMAKAEITRGSRFYEHGLSIGRIADLIGISRWDLMEYSGKTGIADVKESVTKNVRERVKFARSLFK